MPRPRQLEGGGGRCPTGRIFGGMVPLRRLFVTGVLTLCVATACAGATHHRRATGHTGKFPIVVAHPDVQSTGLPSVEIRRLGSNGGVSLSASRVAFMTTGSVTCAWWPARLTVLGPSAIRIDMRVNGRVSACGSGAVGFPIAVKFDPRVVDVRRPVTVRLAYAVRLPGGGGTRRWNRTAVAPAVRS
jgi:hypothetical protein